MKQSCKPSSSKYLIDYGIDYSQSIDIGDSFSNSCNIGDILMDPSSDLEDKLIYRQLSTTLCDMLKSLTNKESRVVKMRMGIGTEHGRVLTFREIGKIESVTFEAVRQTYIKAIRKLQRSNRINKQLKGWN